MVGIHWLSMPPEGQLFNPYTGHPRYVWNQNPHGRIQLFPLGYQVDPSNGVRLGSLTSNVANQYAKQSEEEKTLQPARAEKEKIGEPTPTTGVASIPAVAARTERDLKTRLAYGVLLRVERFDDVGDETIVHVAASGERGSRATLLGPIRRTTYLADQDGHIYELIRLTGSEDVRLVPETELYARFVRTSRGATAYQTNNSIYKLRKDEAIRFALHFERVRPTATTLQFRYSDSAPITLIR
jgi:hypothetical protein